MKITYQSFEGRAFEALIEERLLANGLDTLSLQLLLWSYPTKPSKNVYVVFVKSQQTGKESSLHFDPSVSGFRKAVKAFSKIAERGKFVDADFVDVEVISLPARA